MDGVNTDWGRINAAGLQKAIAEVIKNYSIQYPENSLPALSKIYQSIKKLDESYWRNEKLKELQQIMKECIGLYIEATTNKMFGVQGDSLNINFVADNRAGINVSLTSLKIRNTNFPLDDPLPLNVNVGHSFSVLIPDTAKISQPYWLVYPMTKGNFTVNDQRLIGKPENDPQSAEVTVNLNGESIVYEVPLQYKSNDPVKGEAYQPLFIIPKVEVKSNPEIALSLNNEPVKISTTVTDNGPTSGNASIVAAYSNVTQTMKGAETFYAIKDPAKSNTELIDFSTFMQQNYDRYKKLIQYDHIPNIIYFPKAESKLVAIDLKISGRKVGYIPGAGDKVPDALQKMGYDVTILTQKDITANNLKQFDAIVTGVRAYNIYEWLNDAYDVLMNYVKDGGVLLVQYNTNNNIGPVKAKIGPYPFNISRNRVTDEIAAVTFLQPQNSLMNYPNKITQNDFENWIQERSTYHATDFEKNYQALFSMHDEGEGPQPGSLIYTDYGKGRFVYAGLVFFRELPAGVPGAYRLFANLIATGNNK
jgi:hypothetical protein